LMFHQILAFSASTRNANQGTWSLEQFFKGNWCKKYKNRSVIPRKRIPTQSRPENRIH